MQYTLSTVWILLAAHLFSTTSGQLLDCADVNCTSPSDHINCHVSDQDLLSIGVSEFLSDMLNATLSWTSGISLATQTKLNAPVDWIRTFYLGQPPSTDLRNDSSLTACALLFYGITPHLRFNYSSSGPVSSSSNGTCADALTAQCVSDWTQQAKQIALESNSMFSCVDIADKLAKGPPASCKMAKKSWGKVEAIDMRGSMMPAPLPQSSCSVTMDRTYSATEVFRYNSTDLNDVSTGITPVLTILGKQDIGSEVHLSCLKPIDYDDDSGFQGGSKKLEKSNTLYVLSLLFVASGWMLW